MAEGQPDLADVTAKPQGVGHGLKAVYLAGPIFGCTDEECNGWRDQAKHSLGGYFRLLNPMNFDTRGEEDSLYREIVQFDKQEIDKADHVLVNAERPTWGTAMEVFYAANQGKPVVAFCGDQTPISPWLRSHCLAVYARLSDACDAIRYSTVLTKRR